MADIDRMLSGAKQCNFGRNLVYMLMATTGMLNDLSPVLYYYISPQVLILLFTFFICSSSFLSIVKREYSITVIIIAPVIIYLGMVFIVALKQGTEGRYTYTVEPMVALGAAIGASFLLQKICRFALARLYPDRPHATAGTVE